MLYRIYIDEIGNEKLCKKTEENNNERFLTLTGIISEAEYCKSTIAPKLEELKCKHFPNHHPDDPLVFHASEMRSLRPPYAALRDEASRAAFNSDFLALVGSLNVTLISVTADKTHFNVVYFATGDGNPQDPYLMCLLFLIERYYLFLQDHGGHGDVMIEARDSNKDKYVRRQYDYIFANKIGYIKDFRERLTSREIKIKPKSQNIAGLQLADMIGPCIRKNMINEKSTAPKTDIAAFESALYERVKGKLRCSASGKTEGYGVKFQ